MKVPNPLDLQPGLAPAPLAGRPELSFEFFPPRNPEAEAKLWSTIERLECLGPRFVSVTYGAGGTTRAETFSTVARLRQETAMEPAPHLTCVGAPREEIEEIARGYWEVGVRHILALRGDPPKGETQYRPHSQGFAYATDLVAGLRRVADFDISVACYPEVHPEAASPEADLDNLKRKLDAGATRAVSQFFLDTAAFLRFRDRARRAGITVPLVPGILPVTDVTRTRNFARLCGARVPEWFQALFEGLEDDPHTRNCLGAAIALEQCRSLQAEGVEAFHFYTLNRHELTTAICRMLDLGAFPARLPGRDAAAAALGA